MPSCMILRQYLLSHGVDHGSGAARRLYGVHAESGSAALGRRFRWHDLHMLTFHNNIRLMRTRSPTDASFEQLLEQARNEKNHAERADVFRIFIQEYHTYLTRRTEAKAAGVFI